jgi:NAD(P)-dependent dehydrogenase (short-subunit alcohol dehydrogenase family)
MATVVALAERGTSIVFIDRDEDGAPQTMARTEGSDKVVFRVCEVTDGKDLAAADDFVVEGFGRESGAPDPRGMPWIPKTCGRYSSRSRTPTAATRRPP